MKLILSMSELIPGNFYLVRRDHRSWKSCMLVRVERQYRVNCSPMVKVMVYEIWKSALLMENNRRGVTVIYIAGAQGNALNWDMHEFYELTEEETLTHIVMENL